MTPIFNGVADSGSLAGVDFYRVDIDHAHDIVQHVGGQTVRAFVFPGFTPPGEGRSGGVYSACGTLSSNVLVDACLVHRSPVFTCTSAAINSASSSARILLSYRYVL